MSKKTFNVMLAKDYAPERVERWDDMVIQPKLDGVRCIVLISKNGRNVTVHSRNGRELDMFAHMGELFREVAFRLRGGGMEYYDGVMLDGEMTGTDFGDISGAIHSKDYVAKSARFYCFHAMPLPMFNIRLDATPQWARFKQLERCKSADLRRAGFHVTSTKRVRDTRAVSDWYDEFRSEGYEGAMVKDFAAPWVGKRSYAWMKMKEEISVDVPIVDFKEGKGKYEGTLGALVCEHKGKRFNVSGMSDRARNEIWNNRDMYLGVMVEVTGQEVTKHGSIRHPRFKRLRSDK